MYAPLATRRHAYSQRQQHEGSVFALIFVTVAAAIIFVYEHWRTWRRGSQWRRAATKRGDPWTGDSSS